MQILLASNCELQRHSNEYDMMHCNAVRTEDLIVVYSNQMRHGAGAEMFRWLWLVPARGAGGERDVDFMRSAVRSNGTSLPEMECLKGDICNDVDRGDLKLCRRDTERG